MMVLRKNNLYWLAIGVPVLVMLFLVGLTQTQLFQNSPDKLSNLILLDFLLTVPILFLFLSRRTQIPKFIFLYFILAGIFIAGFILPADQQDLLSQVRSILIPLVEIGLFSMVAYKLYSINKSFKEQEGEEEMEFFEKLKMACSEVLPGKLSAVLATEIAVFYYLFAGKKKLPGEHDFTYFEKSGIKAVLLVFLGLLVMEVVIVHILAERWSTSLAWLLSIFGAYACLQIAAILRSLDKHLISIDFKGELLKLRYGFVNSVDIPFENIDRIEKSSKTLQSEKQMVSLSAFDMIDSHNIILHLKEEQTLNKFYGMKKDFKAIGFYIDEHKDFLEQLDSVREQA